MYYTGCKVSEIREFYSNQINISDGVVVFESGERQSANRIIPIPPVFKIELATYLGPQLKYAPKPLWSLSRIGVWRLVKKVMREANIQGQHATPTGLRHSFAISCLEMNSAACLKYLQYWMGHKDLKLTTSYLDALEYDEASSLEQIWEHI